MIEILRAPPAVSSYVTQDARFFAALTASVNETGLSCMLFGGVLRDILCGVPSEDLDLMVAGDCLPFSRLLASHLTSAGVPLLRSSISSDKLFVSLYFQLPFLNGANKLDLISSHNELFVQRGATDVSLNGCLERADFSINAAALLIEPSSSISFHDPLGAAQDIERKSLRIVRDSIFYDSPKTIIKAFRLRHRTKFIFDERSENALHAASQQRCLEWENPRGLYESIVKACGEESYLEIWEDLEKFGFLSQLFPAEYLDESFTSPPPELFDFGTSFRGEMRLASLLRNTPQTRQYLNKRFSVSFEESDELFTTAHAGSTR